MLLQGLVPATTILEARDSIPKKIRVECKGVWLQLVGTEAFKPKHLQHLAIIELLQEFQEIFKELTSLPPPRGYGHKIKLQEGAKPICVRALQVPLLPKGEY